MDKEAYVGLLEKFDAVEIQMSSRISEADRQFCETQQAAYVAALLGFQELTYFCEGMLSDQKALLGQLDNSPHSYRQYMVSDSDDGPKITIQRLRIQIDSLHRRYIGYLANYFQSAYGIEIKKDKLEAALLQPRPPKKGPEYKKALKEYLLWSSSIQLRYEDVLLQIFDGFDGWTFSETVFQELCRRCNKEAWSSLTHKANFEQKYAVISFQGSFCTFRRRKKNWEFDNSMKPILTCAAHFETGELELYPAGFPKPSFEDGISTNPLVFSSLEKLEQIRMFKNGRVDLRFSNEQYAAQFIDTYIGSSYQEPKVQVVG